MEKNIDEVAMLVAQTGPLDGQRWALRSKTIVGREASCDIVISDRQVSRHHAHFTVTPEGVIVEDLGSKNGTHLNGNPIKGPVTLQDGDMVQIALAQKFVFLSSDATVPLDTQETAIRLSPVASLRPTVGIARLRLEKRSRRVWINKDQGGLIEANEVLPPLSASQFRLLEALYENQGRVVSRRDLIAKVWGEEQAIDVSEQALDALVRRLRDRLATVDPDHSYVVTVRGHGLRLENPEISS